MRSLKFGLTSAIICLAFIYGAVTVKYQIFPFTQMQAVKQFFYPNQNRSTYYYHKKSFFKVHGRRAEIVMIGDSLTDYALWQELFPFKKIANRGIDGDTSGGVLERLDDIYSIQAKKAFFMIGFNDFRGGVNVNEVFLNYKQILEGLIKAGITPYVQSTLFAGKHFLRLNDKIAALNGLLMTYCTNQKITFIDLNTSLSKNKRLISDYSLDGVHLNGKGYQLWADTIRPYLD